MPRTPLLAALALPLLLAACAEDSETTCDSEIANATSRFGGPEDVSTTSADDYSVTTLYWWSQGRSQTFTGTSEGCDISSRTFSPI